MSFSSDRDYERKTPWTWKLHNLKKREKNFNYGLSGMISKWSKIPIIGKSGWKES